MIRNILYCISYCMISGSFKLFNLIFPNFIKKDCLGKEIFGRRGMNYITYRVFMRRIKFDNGLHWLLFYGPGISVLFFLIAILINI